MREIKFRAWIPTLIESPENVLVELNSEEIDEIIEAGNPIMQYTGLKDKNGVEIYEGDIVETLYDGEKDIYEIKWTGDVITLGYASQGLLTLKSIGHEFEVIGNIYEHGDLLNDPPEIPGFEGTREALQNLGTDKS